LTQYRRVTDKRTDGRTDGIAIANTALAMRALRRSVIKPEIQIGFLRLCKLQFRLVHCGTIRPVTRCGFRQVLHSGQKCDRFYIWCFGNHKPEIDNRF